MSKQNFKDVIPTKLKAVKEFKPLVHMALYGKD